MQKRVGQDGVLKSMFPVTLIHHSEFDLIIKKTKNKNLFDGTGD